MSGLMCIVHLRRHCRLLVLRCLRNLKLRLELLWLWLTNNSVVLVRLSSTSHRSTCIAGLSIRPEGLRHLRHGSTCWTWSTQLVIIFLLYIDARAKEIDD